MKTKKNKGSEQKTHKQHKNNGSKQFLGQKREVKNSPSPNSGVKKTPRQKKGVKNSYLCLLKFKSWMSRQKKVWTNLLFSEVMIDDI